MITIFMDHAHKPQDRGGKPRQVEDTPTASTELQNTMKPKIMILTKVWPAHRQKQMLHHFKRNTRQPEGSPQLQQQTRHTIQQRKITISDYHGAIYHIREQLYISEVTPGNLPAEHSFSHATLHTSLHEAIDSYLGLSWPMSQQMLHHGKNYASRGNGHISRHTHRTTLPGYTIHAGNGMT